MLINGAWFLASDGVLRPVIRAEVEGREGAWIAGLFLVDTAADCMVFSAHVLHALGLEPLETPAHLAGVGGRAASVAVETRVQMVCDDASTAVFRGRFAAFTELEALDMSVLGRDILNLFAAIVDRPGDRVCLVGQRHRYRIEAVP